MKEQTLFVAHMFADTETPVNTNETSTANEFSNVVRYYIEIQINILYTSNERLEILMLMILLKIVHSTAGIDDSVSSSPWAKAWWPEFYSQTPQD